MTKSEFEAQVRQLHPGADIECTESGICFIIRLMEGGNWIDISFDKGNDHFYFDHYGLKVVGMGLTYRAARANAIQKYALVRPRI